MSFTKLLIILSILLFGLSLSLVVFKVTYNNQTKDIKTKNQQILDQYSNNIKTENDAYKLTVAGLHQLDVNLPDLALISLKQATVANPSYRDGWLALGSAQFDTANFNNALISFQTAAKLDPIFPETYRLLQITYNKLGQNDASKLAQTKYELLAK